MNDKTNEEQIIELENKIIERSKKHRVAISRLIAIQIRFTEQLFDAVDKSIKNAEISHRNVKHVPSTPLKWEVKRMRSISLNQLRAAQDGVAE